MALRDLYGNTSKTGFTINFFMHAGMNPRVGLLAAPFFTTTAPIEALTNKFALNNSQPTDFLR